MLLHCIPDASVHEQQQGNTEENEVRTWSNTKSSIVNGKLAHLSCLFCISFSLRIFTICTAPSLINQFSSTLETKNTVWSRCTESQIKGGAKCPFLEWNIFGVNILNQILLIVIILSCSTTWTTLHFNRNWKMLGMLGEQIVNNFKCYLFLQLLFKCDFRFTYNIKVFT